MTPDVAGLDLPALDPDDKLHRVLAAALGSKSAQATIEIDAAPWDAHFFGLTRISLFQTATVGEQTRILQRASQDLLVEAYSLERAGVGYMAKMTLLAETVEERMIYALFGAEETQHLARLRPFIPEDAAQQGSKDLFLRLLMPLLETADRPVLLFVIQVVLEGWGLSHYRHLSKACRHRGLAELFHSFLEAEARHHGTGVMLFNRATLSSTSCAAIVDTLASFLEIVRVGPQRLVEAIAMVKGDLTRSQRIALLTELDSETHSGLRLNLLRSLIEPLAPDIVETLAQRNLFLPLPPGQCV